MTNAATERKRRSREKLGQRIELPLPIGTAAALARICEACGFDDQREAISTMIHRLDACPKAELAEFLKHPTRVGDLSKFIKRLEALSHVDPLES